MSEIIVIFRNGFLRIPLIGFCVKNQKGKFVFLEGDALRCPIIRD